MTNRLKYETKGGNLSALDTYKQLLNYLTEAEEDCRSLSNLRKGANDSINARRWKQIADNFTKVSAIITGLAKSKAHSSIGFTNG